MEISQYEITVMILQSAALGFASGILYDVFDAVSIAIGRVAVHILNFLFAVICGIAVILMLYDFNDGVFRASVPISFTLGYFGYRIIKIRPVYRLTLSAVRLIRRIIGFIFVPMLKTVQRQKEKAALKKATEKRKNREIIPVFPEAVNERQYKQSEKHSRYRITEMSGDSQSSTR